MAGVSGQDDHPRGTVRIIAGENEDWNKTAEHARARYLAATQYGALHVELAEGRILAQISPPASGGANNGWTPPAGFDPRRIYCDVGPPGSVASVEVTYNVSGEANESQSYHIYLERGQSRSVVGALKIRCHSGRISVYGNYTKPLVTDTPPPSEEEGD